MPFAGSLGSIRNRSFCSLDWLIYRTNEQLPQQAGCSILPAASP
jgi:hypothetical protein